MDELVKGSVLMLYKVTPFSPSLLPSHFFPNSSTVLLTKTHQYYIFIMNSTGRIKEVSS